MEHALPSSLEPLGHAGSGPADSLDAVRGGDAGSAAALVVLPVSTAGREHRRSIGGAPSTHRECAEDWSARRAGALTGAAAAQRAVESSRG